MVTTLHPAGSRNLSFPFDLLFSLSYYYPVSHLYLYYNCFGTSYVITFICLFSLFLTPLGIYIMVGCI